MKPPEISLLDLTSKSLQAVYNEEHDELNFELANQARINDNGKSFRYELTMCFWLAIHLEKTRITPFIYEQDEWLKKLAHFIAENYQNLPLKERKVTENAMKFHRKITLDPRKVLEENPQAFDDDEDESDLDLSQEYDFSDLKTVK